MRLRSLAAASVAGLVIAAGIAIAPGAAAAVDISGSSSVSSLSQPKGIGGGGLTVSVANSGFGTITTVNTCTTKVCGVSALGSVDVGSSPSDVAYTQNNVLVTNTGSNTVSIMSSATSPNLPNVLSTVPVGFSPTGIDTDGATTAYVANNGSNTVSVIDIPSATVTATIPVGAGPWGVLVTSSTVYVANNGGNSVSIINRATNAVTQTVSVGTAPAQLALNGTNLYVTNNGDGTLTTIDTVSQAVTSTDLSGSQPWGVAIGGGAVFVANYGAGTVSVFNAESGAPITTITTGGSPFGLTVLSDKLFITNTSLNALQVVPVSISTQTPDWSKNNKKRSVTGVVPNQPGYQYAITASKGKTTKKGACTPQGANVNCTVKKLGKGKWKLNITAAMPWQQTPGGQQNAKFTFK